MKHHAIAIDGPSGAGKSTMAKATAKELGYLYVDTGAIYRTVGYHMWLMGIGPKDADGIRRLIDDVNIVIDHQADGVQHMILNGMDVTAELRTPEMSRYASGVSAQPCVREYLLDMQRQFAREHDVVMDGRDIGTVVLPRADVKIFLTASPEERARRRFEELQAKGDKSSYAQVLDEMKKRDKQDSERDIAPLRPARDAVMLDTSGNTIEQSVQEILEIVREETRMTFWYRLCWWICRIGLFFWHPVLHVHGRELVPAGCALLCANHSGMADPIWIMLALNSPKMIRILAKEELRRVPFLGWVMEKFDIIFVRRGAHQPEVYKKSTEALARGRQAARVRGRDAVQRR